MLSALCDYLRDPTTFEKEKELTDRALKLAEVGKPKPNWWLQGLLGTTTSLHQITIFMCVKDL